VAPLLCIQIDARPRHFFSQPAAECTHRTHILPGSWLRSQSLVLTSLRTHTHLAHT